MEPFINKDFTDGTVPGRFDCNAFSVSPDGRKNPDPLISHDATSDIDEIEKLTFFNVKDVFVLNADLGKENVMLKKENAELKDENADLKKENDLLKAKIAELEAEKASFQAEIEKFEQEIVNLKEELTKTVLLAFIAENVRALSHDMKNALGNIITIVGLIEEDGYSQDNLNLLKIAYNELKGLLESLLKFLKNEAEKPEYFNLSVHLTELAPLFKTISTTKKLFETNIPVNDDLNIRAIPGEINRVITNLCSNAFQAMEKVRAAKLILNLEEVHLDDSNNMHLPAGKYAKISVIDNGSGISKDVLPRIFDAGFSTKKGVANGGSGIGLSHSLAIVKKYGGDIKVVSEVDKGTTFEVLIPVANFEEDSLN